MKLFQGDLSSASSKVRAGVDNINSGAKTTEEQISAFVADSISALQGKGFDYVRSKMSLYLAAVNKLSSITDMLANNVVQANNFMANETQGYDLDTANIEELEQRVTQIKSLISWYSQSVCVDDSVPDEEKKYKMRNAEMKAYYEEVLAVIEEKLDLLRRLPEISASAASLLGPISSDTGSFASGVNGITISNISI